MARQKKVVEENPAPKKRGRKAKAEEIPIVAPVMEKPVDVKEETPVKKTPGRKRTVKETPEINVVKLIEESAALKAENTQLKAEIVRLKKAIADLA